LISYIKKNQIYHIPENFHTIRLLSFEQMENDLI